MKKSLILVGLLSIGYAHAQEGRVGINTETPSATLNVKSKVNNGKNLELENLAGTKLVTILDDGRVGINNDDPKAILHMIAPGFGLVNDIIIEDYNTRENVLGDPSALIFNRNRGTIDTPALLKQGDNIGQIIFSTRAGSKGYLLEQKLGEIGSDYKGSGKGSLYFRTSGIDRVLINEEGKVQISDLSGAGDRVVYADKNGVLKIGTASAGITQELDGVIGNEVVDATQNGGLVRAGSGTADAPYTLGIKEGGVIGTMLAANSVDGSKIASNAVTGEKIANGSVSSAKLNIPGAIEGQVLTYKGNQWVASAPAATGLTREEDGIVGNEVVDVVANRGLERKGTGTQNDPYKVGLIAGTKVGQTLVWNGSAWEAKEATPSSEGTLTRNFREDSGSIITVRDTDYFIHLSGTVTQVNLPTPSESNKGRIVCIYNEGTGDGTMVPQPIGQQQTLAAGQTVCYISSGSKWINASGY